VTSYDAYIFGMLVKQGAVGAPLLRPAARKVYRHFLRGMLSKVKAGGRRRLVDVAKLPELAGKILSPQALQSAAAKPPPTTVIGNIMKQIAAKAPRSPIGAPAAILGKIDPTKTLVPVGRSFMQG
jgi:hypothetical protein